MIKAAPRAPPLAGYIEGTPPCISEAAATPQLPGRGVLDVPPRVPVGTAPAAVAAVPKAARQSSAGGWWLGPEDEWGAWHPVDRGACGAASIIRKGVVHKEFVPQGQTVNTAYYVDELERIRKRVIRMREHISATWQLHHDNTPCHNMLRVHKFLVKQQIKAALKGISRDEDLRDVPEDAFQGAYQSWQRQAEHLEKNTAHIEWKRHLEVMKAKVLEQIHNQLSDRLDKTLEEATHSRPQQLSMVAAKKQSREKGELLKKKIFVPQQSLVDTLLEVEHFRTIRHIFVAMLCIFVLKQIIVDSIDEGSLVLDFELFINGFRQLPTALFAWLCMFLYTLFVPYQALQIWSGCLKMTRFPNLLKATLVLLVIICHIAVLFVFPIYIVVYCNLGIASRAIVVMEQIRFLMKSYSFLRESMPPLLHARDQVGKTSPPEFSTYLYFLFCPTLIYRKSYPRDPYIRWSYVIRKLVEFLAGIYFVNFLLKYYLIPNFSNMHKQPFKVKILLLSSFDSVMPGISFLLMMFYCFLDCWQNVFAEILRFADRSFYKVMIRGGGGCKKDM
ncbi:sterol O-acyltransferase 2-like [Erythrolamprus reginae]|uniref:sterol O-acyltransferase 2-like n=1 Tax=Erythrolamprus reginae TaxID=121349 RepID=UPI00396C408D